MGNLREEDRKRTLLLYKNGVLIGNKFISYATRKGERLREMLRHRKIYADLVEESGEYIDVVIAERNEKYEAKCGEVPKVVGQSTVQTKLPDEIIVDERGDVFKILVCGRRVTVKMNGERKMGDLAAILRGFVEGDIALFSGCEAVSDEDAVEKVKQSLVKVLFKPQ